MPEVGHGGSQANFRTVEEAPPDSWKDPAEAVPAGRGWVPTFRGRAPALEARCTSRVPSAGGSIAQRGIPRERGAQGWDLGLGLPKLSLAEAGWWAGWEALSEGDRLRMRARRPNTDETCGCRAGVGVMEPGCLGRGRNGESGWGATSWPEERGRAPGDAQLLGCQTSPAVSQM